MNEATQPIKHTKETRKQAEEAVKTMFETLKALEYEFRYLVPGKGRSVFKKITMGDTDIRAITPYKRRERLEGSRERLHPSNDGQLRRYFDEK